MEKRKCYECHSDNISEYSGTWAVWDPKARVWKTVWHCNTCGNTWDKVKGKKRVGTRHIQRP